MTAVEDLTWPENGLLPVVITDVSTGDVLTLAYANREALERTLATRETHLYSRSRQALWRKGETSGNTQRVVEIVTDCDQDAIVYKVIPNGPACHTGATSCFSEKLTEDVAGPDGAGFAAEIRRLGVTIAARKTNPPEGSYTAKLFAGGVGKIAQKVGEEASETIVAAMENDRDAIVWETADLLYHTLVLLAERGVPLDAVGAELRRRSS